MAPDASGIKTPTVIILHFLSIRISRAAELGGLAWGFSGWHCSQDVRQGLGHLETWLGLEHPLTKWLAHTTVTRRSQLLATLTSPQDCLSVLTHGSYLPPEQVTQEGARLKAQCPFELAPEATPQCFRNIPLQLHKSALSNMRGDHIRSWIPRGEDHWGHLGHWLL